MNWGMLRNVTYVTIYGRIVLRNFTEFLCTVLFGIMILGIFVILTESSGSSFTQIIF